MTTRVPAVEGWFTSAEDGTAGADRLALHRLRHLRLPGASGVTAGIPTATGRSSRMVALSRRGRIWSYTDARYQPPPPYVPADPYVPFCLAAVELAAEKLVVMGQMVGGVTVDDLTVGDEVELVADTLYADDDQDYLVWKWKPVPTPEEA